MYFFLGVCNNSNLFLRNFVELKDGCVFTFVLFVMCYCSGHIVRAIGDPLVIRIYRGFFRLSIIQPAAKCLLKYDSEEMKKREGVIASIVNPNYDPQDPRDLIVFAEIQVFRAQNLQYTRCLQNVIIICINSEKIFLSHSVSTAYWHCSYQSLDVARRWYLFLTFLVLPDLGRIESIQTPVNWYLVSWIVRIRSLKNSMSRKPYACLFITLILLFRPSRGPVEMLKS